MHCHFHFLTWVPCAVVSVSGCVLVMNKFPKAGGGGVFVLFLSHSSCPVQKLTIEKCDQLGEGKNELRALCRVSDLVEVGESCIIKHFLAQCTDGRAGRGSYTLFWVCSIYR